MRDNDSRDASGDDAQDTDAQQKVGIPIRLVGGNASPEELTAIVAVVAVLTNTVSDSGDSGDSGDTDQGDRHFRRGTSFGLDQRPRWASPARMVRTTYPRGPGGWRASALRADRARFWG